jgi:hypothetical protein
MEGERAMTLHPQKRGLAACAVALALLFTTAVVLPSVAHAAPAPAHKKNWVQRHPTMTGIGAGLATHHALKVSAARKKARGQKLNWAERHPTMSGIGVGTVTRHVIKTHTPKQ